VGLLVAHRAGETLRPCVLCGDSRNVIVTGRALRRAGRAAIIMPALFAVGEKVIGNSAVATSAAFGSFALLLLVDFPGPVRDRLQALGLLALAGGVL
jgi:hypothetical protein